MKAISRELNSILIFSFTEAHQNHKNKCLKVPEMGLFSALILKNCKIFRGFAPGLGPQFKPVYFTLALPPQLTDPGYVAATERTSEETATKDYRK